MAEEKQKKHFFGDIKKELKKVIWPTKKQTAKNTLSVIAIVFIFLGTLASNDLVWELTDFFNYLMVLPNAIALFALGGMVVTMTKFGKDKDDLQ